MPKPLQYCEHGTPIYQCPPCKKERAANYRRAFQKRNREQIAADAAARYRADPEKYRARAKANRAAKIEKYREYEKKYRDKLREQKTKARLEAQNYLCAICPEDISGPRQACADHDHVSGKDRDMLCQGCNPGLGSFKDNPVLLQRAIYYLIRHDAGKLGDYTDPFASLV